MTIDITGLPAEGLVFGLSPLAELGAALHTLAEPAHHPGLHGWATATAAGLKPDLAERLHEANFLWTATMSDVFLPYAGVREGHGTPPRPGETLAEELDLLDRLDEERFVAAALEFVCCVSYMNGEPVRPARALEMAANRGPRQLDFTRRLLDDPGGVRAWLRRLFEDCDKAFFADTWRRLQPALAADAREKAGLLRRKGLDEAVRAVSSAMSVREEDGRRLIHMDKMLQGRTTAVDPGLGTGVTFLPSRFGWPHLVVLSTRGWRPVVQYPIGVQGVPGTASVDLLQRRMEALAHPMRMRLCRQLARGAYTTSELAEAYGITAPEVSRHLSVLKKAELVSVRRRGRYVLHQLDVSAVARIGGDFLETVLR
ncbi:helix-turn-helix transcriptional regulator [Streptomyces sp. MUM 203J]|uniref:DUF5937 family protein n=1 Tax=Streptomyces sp. MUM 203J TaxID=2791990 RepID=UPI001F03A37D|nr:DUF5937 family protein [Streptomyces sp. MUM 203J]MCH0540728.1 helix-turn-helix transcriptional regulator [Streptomyces sp. MUM 203J]